MSSDENRTTPPRPFDKIKEGLEEALEVVRQMPGKSDTTPAEEHPDWAALKSACSKVVAARRALRLAEQEYAEARARMYGVVTHDGD